MSNLKMSNIKKANLKMSSIVYRLSLAGAITFLPERVTLALVPRAGGQGATGAEGVTGGAHGAGAERVTFGGTLGGTTFGGTIRNR